MRQVFGAVEQRIDDVLAIAVHHRLEIAVAHGLAEGAGLQHPLGHLDPDLAPLVDDPQPVELVGLVDIAVEQLEGQVLLPGFLEQPSCLGARLLDIGPKAGQLLQLCLGRG